MLNYQILIAEREKYSSTLTLSESLFFSTNLTIEIRDSAQGLTLTK